MQTNKPNNTSADQSTIFYDALDALEDVISEAVN